MEIALVARRTKRTDGETRRRGWLEGGKGGRFPIKETELLARISIFGFHGYLPR